VVTVDTTVAAQQLSSLFAGPAELCVLIIVIVILDNGGAILLAMRAAPFALRSFIQFWVQAAQMISLRASVTEDDFSTLLANFTELLVVGFFLSKVLLPFLTLLFILVTNLGLGFALLLLSFFLGFLNSCHIVCRKASQRAIAPLPSPHSTRISKGSSDMISTASSVSLIASLRARRPSWRSRLPT